VFAKGDVRNDCSMVCLYTKARDDA
jgi:hypothetical protein